SRPSGSGWRSSALLLAARAVKRRAVHEAGALDQRAATAAGQALAAVGVQPPFEVARFAVHVDIQGVKARPARVDRLAQHLLHLAEEPLGSLSGERVGGAVAVDSRAPQGLVGIDVA